MSAQLVLFKVNDEVFAININSVNIIEKITDIYKVPDTPVYIEGLINLRGKVHTVFNVRKKFGYPQIEFDESTRIIILNHESVVGLLVDEVCEIISVEDTGIKPAPELISGLSGKFFSGIAEKDGKIILIFDLDKLLEK
ncbi:purine-binding chemotaxis protein CheW [Ruminiclostridium sufflavum DSM 19573]|uniref:Purine-binding chemotaxis protein CheW n=1 Tax=Ruminiclostridium sufflavum DSM 19573 TaxID=1121337 RepID=A0A318XNR3_9FIRM|nr:chemotaxis protein CheW [Ruminiclostridium sufflavum]PYG89770.1 purine-binding chemotaxis protein CheW [Ruminiclostridium sufflavum DSM 19573]